MIKELPPDAITCGCDKPESTPAAVPETLSGKRWVEGFVSTPAGPVPRVSTRLAASDKLGALKVRWGFGRSDYRVPPGLYAAGDPDPSSPVLVTANYKLTFDSLRREIGGLQAWILVLDTRGINVWCAAGKGTFSTEEVVERIAATGLSRVVKHRKVILPQLGAPGTAAHEVQKRSGFRVVYGPVLARDIPAFLRSGEKAEEGMRQVPFGLRDRLKLVSMELRGGLKYLLAAAVVVFLLEFIFFRRVRPFGLVPYLGAILAGSALTPLLLPWIPGRAFSFKGALAGLVWTLLLIGGGLAGFLPSVSWKQSLVYLLVLPSLSAFLAMNFTGSSTFTSLSGVVKEMKTAVPIMAASFLAGAVFFVVKSLIPF